MANVTADDINKYGEYLKSQGQPEKDVNNYLQYLGKHHGVDLIPKEESSGIKSPVVTNETAQDLLTGAGEHIPLIPQIGGVGDIINASLSGDIDPTDINDLKKTYEAGRQKVVKAQEEATPRSPIANRIGQGIGLVAGAEAIPGGKLVDKMARYGGAMAATQGATPFITGNDKQRQQVENNIALQGSVNAALGKGGELAGQGLAKLGETPAGKAFLKSMQGVKLTGPKAISNLSQDVNSQVENASSSVERLRKALGLQRDVIENTGETADLSKPMSEMKAHIESIPENPRLSQGKQELRDLIGESAPPTDVEAENALNEMGKEVEPAENPNADLEASISRMAEAQGLGGKITPEGLAVNQEATEQGLGMKDPLTEMEIMAKEQGLATPPEETVAPQAPAAKETSVKDALAIRGKLRVMANDMTQPAEVRNAAKAMMGSLQEGLQEVSPAIRQNDALYNAIKNTQSLFGKGYTPSGRLVPTKGANSLIKQIQSNTVSGGNAQQAFQKAMSELEKVDPTVANQIQKTLGESVENLNLAKQAQAPEWSLKGLGNAPTFIGAKAGELGHAIGKNPVVSTSRALYNASSETLKGVANTLQNTEGGRSLGAALNKAIDDKNEIMKNAALFSIMQNPMLRKAIGSGDEQ